MKLVPDFCEVLVLTWNSELCQTGVMKPGSLSYFSHYGTEVSIQAEPSQCQLSAAPSSFSLPDCVCAMMSCCCGGVFGGVVGVLVLEGAGA